MNSKTLLNFGIRVEEIRERTGFVESQVIGLMLRELKPSCFRCWRKRVSGRVTKHRKLLELRLKG